MRIVIVVCCALALVSCGKVSNHAKKNYDEGVLAWQAGKEKQSIELLQKAVSDSPRYYQAYTKLGEYYTFLREYQKAIEVITTALRLQNENVEALLLLGEAYSEKEEYLKGQHQFSQVLVRAKLTEEERFRAYLGKGICKLKLTLVEDAGEYLQKALALKADHPKAIFYYALLREAQIGPNTLSMQDYKKVMQTDPRHLGALKQIGDTWKSLEHDEKAVIYYKRFLAAGGVSREIEEYLKQADLLATPKKVEKQVVVCPDCNRIGKKGQTTCEFDGSPLVPQ